MVLVAAVEPLVLEAHHLPMEVQVVLVEVLRGHQAAVVLVFIPALLLFLGRGRVMMEDHLMLTLALVEVGQGVLDRQTLAALVVMVV
jgi:hypothetical protein